VIDQTPKISGENLQIEGVEGEEGGDSNVRIKDLSPSSTGKCLAGSPQSPRVGMRGFCHDIKEKSRVTTVQGGFA